MKKIKCKCSCGREFNTRAERFQHSMLFAGPGRITSPNHFLVDNNSILTEEKWKKIASETKPHGAKGEENEEIKDHNKISAC